MKIKIYQVNLDRDSNGVAFESFERLPSIQNSEAINSELYDRVFNDEVDCDNLESVYQKFNIDHPEGYRGRSLSVSDIVEIVESDNVEPGFYYCDSVGFQKVEFDDELAEILKEEKITVVICEPGKFARVTEIATDLGSLQATVGGNIETFYPFEEEVCLVCDDEGKINGSPLNRAIYDSDGNIMDIMAGTFFICDVSTPNFGSLSKEQQERFTKQFLYPENFIRINNEIKALKFKPETNRDAR